MQWIETGLQSFFRQSGLVSLSSVCTLSFYFLREEEMSSYGVNRERGELLPEKKKNYQIVLKLR